MVCRPKRSQKQKYTQIPSLGLSENRKNLIVYTQVALEKVMLVLLSQFLRADIGCFRDVILGAMVAISHDIQFCEALEPTHIARVDTDGSVTISLCINGDLGSAPKPKAQATASANSKGKKKPPSTNVTTMTKPVRAYGGAAHAKPESSPDPKRVQQVFV